MLQPSQTSSDNLIEVKNLRFSRAGKRIFDNLNINIARGKVTAIMGPSGTGKTSLLRLITGQLIPDRGDIDVDGASVPKLSLDGLYDMRKQIGMLFQNGALLTDYSVFENVAFPLREHTDLPESLISHLVLMKLQAVGLRGAAGLMPSELSGGMARRTALARAIVMDPKIILYDEPFTGLDPISMGVVVRLIRVLNDTLNLTSLVVSHDVEEISSVADCSFLISDGQVVAYGTPEELEHNQSAWVRQFMNGLADGPVPFHYPGPDYATQLLGEEGR